MTHIAHHIVIRLSDHRTLLHDTAERRLFARTTYKIADPFGLLAFRSADTHAHVMAACERRDAGRLARQLEHSLSRRLHLPVAFAPAQIRPVRDQSHLRNTFHYTLKQERHHAIDCDPYHDASSLPELLGLRLLSPETPQRVTRLLPRVRVEQLRVLLPSASAHANDTPPSLSECAAAALGIANITNRSREAQRGRRAVVQLCPDLATASLALRLGCSSDTIRRDRAAQPEPALLAAIRSQIGLRSPQPDRATPANPPVYARCS